MNKFWKQTMALSLAFALVFGTLVPVVAWAEEPASVDAPTEEQMQAETEEQLPAEETEGKKTEENEELEFSEENTPAAQGAPMIWSRSILKVKEHTGRTGRAHFGKTFYFDKTS